MYIMFIYKNIYKWEKKMLKKFDGIIFDLDGTLFQTDKLALHAFNKTFEMIQDEGYKIDIVPNSQEVLAVIGLTLENIWEQLLPNLPKKIHNIASEYLLMFEIEGIKGGFGDLYPGVMETLITLKYNGYRLYIASNGLKEYVHEVTNNFNINHLFNGIYSSKDFNTNSKDELVKMIMEYHNFDKGVMVGDRLSDVEAGIKNNLFVIGCDFGFSKHDEIFNSDIIINDFKKITEIIVCN